MRSFYIRTFSLAVKKINPNQPSIIKNFSRYWFFLSIRFSVFFASKVERFVKKTKQFQFVARFFEDVIFCSWITNEFCNIFRENLIKIQREGISGKYFSRKVSWRRSCWRDFTSKRWKDFGRGSKTSGSTKKYIKNRINAVIYSSVDTAKK